MGARTTEDVKQDIESERERLGDAVHTLRGQAVKVRRRLPFVAIGVAAVGVLAGLARRRVSRRHEPDTRGRARLPFRDRR